MKRAFWSAALVAALVIVVAGSAATLPGGTSIDATITSHIDDQTIPAGPTTVTATGSVGTGVAVANTTLIYIVDVSRSTGADTGGTNCPNQNVYDDVANTTLDCELLAIRNLNAAAIATGTVAKIGVIAFGGGAVDDPSSNPVSAQVLDLDPMAEPSLIPPNLAPSVLPSDSPIGIRPTNNLELVLQSAYLNATDFPSISTPPGFPAKGLGNGFTLFSPRAVGSFTNFAAAMLRLGDLLPQVTTPRIQVVMLSDGAATRGVSGATMSGILDDIVVRPTTTLAVDTFAIGADAECGLAGGTDPGTLAQIAAEYGRTCTRIEDPNEAVTAVPAAIASKLTNVVIGVDGTETPFTITPALTGPGSTTRSVEANLSPGAHELCASASGSDGGGRGESPLACITVYAKAAPIPSPPSGGGDDPVTGVAGTVPEGSPFPVSVNASDTFTSASWSATGGTGNCVFADPAALSTTVTCDDDGTYALTITLADGVNSPTSFTEHLAVSNVAPRAAATPSATTVPLSAANVDLRVGIVDPGSDVWTCGIAWDDSTETLPITTTTPACAASHTYTAPGVYDITGDVTDGDGGGASFGPVTITVVGPPAITGVPATATIGEGSPYPLNASAPSAITSRWLGGTTACDLGPSSVTCDDNGVYTFTFEATDQYGQISTKDLVLTVTNVTPTLIATGPPAGSSARTVTFTGSVFDPGTADTHTCAVNWGDGSALETVNAISGTCTATHTYAASVASTVIVATARDDDGALSDAVMRALRFNRPPLCSAVAPNVAVLWPANHKLVRVALSGATDPDGDSLTYVVTGVRQDEALNGLGDGDRSPDAQLAPGGRVYLRAERSGNGDGRVYTVSYTVSDPNGGSCAGSVRVTVPHSPNKPAVETPSVNVNSLG